MRIFRHVDFIPEECRGSVIVLGNFDGFHRGHQKVIGLAGKVAHENQVEISVLSMEPHPRLFFAPLQKEFRLNSFRTKVHLFDNFGIDYFFVLPFDQNLATTEAEKFVLDILIDKFGASHIVVGYDYCFGAGRKGNVTLLERLARENNFGLTVVPKVMDNDQVYSSTLIRHTLEQGNVREVANKLGHWWHVEGHVKKGDQRGRTINFPTANLSLEGYIQPKYGVYAVRVIIDEMPYKGVWNAIANIGRRPTFNKLDILLEVHIFHFNHNNYERSIKVEFVDFIRSEIKFDGLDSLKKQIEKDCIVAKELLAKPQNQQSILPTPKLTDYIS